MKLLKEMIKDESKAPKDYNRLLKQLTKESDKKVIRGIIKQEREHKKKLLRIK